MEEGACEINFQEPQVTSLNSEERKLARRLRIERRIKNLGRQNLSEGRSIETAEEVQKTILQQQLDKSEEILERMVLEGCDAVTSFHIISDGREVDRRDSEEIAREKILQQLEEDGVLAQRMFDEIADKWAKILKSSDPLVIHEEMESQKEKCGELVKQKEMLIIMLREEIRQAEVKFTNDQKKQKADIKSLTELIEQQMRMMRKAYKDELKIIEEIVVVERHMLSEMNDRIWDELYNRRENEERKQLEKLTDQRTDFLDKMKTLQLEFQEKYRELNICLGEEQASLVQDIEKLKAMVMMNTEKVDYNYQILKRREDENIIIKSQQKRRMNKLQDVINNLRTKIRDYDEKTKSESARLKSEVKNMQKCLLEIENKSNSLSKINDLKHKQVWNLNMKNANELLHRILAVDRILYEQQLGLEWKKPEAILLSKVDLRSYKIGMDAMKLGKVTLGSSLSHSGSSIGKSLVVANIDFKKSVGYNDFLQRILEQIVDTAGFLIEEKFKDILSPYIDEEQNLIKIDNVFTALGIKNFDDIDLMFKYFFPYAHCSVCSKSAVSLRLSDITVSEKYIIEEETTEVSSARSLFPILMRTVNEPEDVINDVLQYVKTTEINVSDSISTSSASIASEITLTSKVSKVSSSPKQDPLFVSHLEKLALGDRLKCKQGHPLDIHSVYIIKAMQEFINDFYSEKFRPQITSNVEHKCTTISRMLTEEDMKLFWSKYMEIFTKERLWDGLLEGLKMHHEILRDRKKVSDEVVCLRKKNRELKQILNKYRFGKMKIPPCAKQREIPVQEGAIYCTKLY